MRPFAVLVALACSIAIVPAGSAGLGKDLVPPVESPDHGTIIPLLTRAEITSIKADNFITSGAGSASATGQHGHFKLYGKLMVNYLTRSESGSYYRKWETLCEKTVERENFLGSVTLDVSCSGAPSGRVLTSADIFPPTPVTTLYVFEAYVYSHDAIWGYDNGYAGWDSDSASNSRAV